jgi:hypothetical protein
VTEESERPEPRRRQSHGGVVSLLYHAPYQVLSGRCAQFGEVLWYWGRAEDAGDPDLSRGTGEGGRRVSVLWARSERLAGPRCCAKDLQCRGSAGRRELHGRRVSIDESSPGVAFSFRVDVRSDVGGVTYASDQTPWSYQPAEKEVAMLWPNGLISTTTQDLKI